MSPKGAQPSATDLDSQIKDFMKMDHRDQVAFQVWLEDHMFNKPDPTSPTAEKKNKKSSTKVARKLLPSVSTPRGNEKEAPVAPPAPITATPKRPREDTDQEDTSPFIPVLSKKQKKAASATKETRNPTPKRPQQRKRPSPLVIEGPLVKDCQGIVDLRKKASIPDRIRITRTKAGTHLLHPPTEADRADMTTKGDPTTFTIRPTKRQQERGSTKPAVVVTKFPTSVNVSTITSRQGETYHRFRSAKLDMDIRKIKVECSSTEQQQDLLDNGFSHNHLKYRCEEYKPTRPLLQCYRCQKYGHSIKECQEKEDTCRKCSQPHKTSTCQENQKKCANCQGSHSSTFKGCEAHQEAASARKTRSLTYAQAAKKSTLMDEEIVKLTMALLSTFHGCMKDHPQLQPGDTQQDRRQLHGRSLQSRHQPPSALQLLHREQENNSVRTLKEHNTQPHTTQP